MLLTTTGTLQGVTIERHPGIAIGQSVVGESFTKQFRTGIRDVSTGHRRDYGVELDKAREAATAQMVDRTKALGADAIGGIDLDFETSGETTHLAIVSLAGAAVVLSELEKA